MLLKNKIALVTASTNNIGLGITRGFARERAKVAVHAGLIMKDDAGGRF